MRWLHGLNTLKRDFQLPQYFLRLIGDYSKDRFIVYDTEDDPKRKELTAGAAQGSLLGPDIWKASYDGILRMEMPDRCFLIGYADNVAALISARYEAHLVATNSLLLRAAESIMLQSTDVWADSMRYENYRKRLAAVQRTPPHGVFVSHGLGGESLSTKRRAHTVIREATNS